MKTSIFFLAAALVATSAQAGFMTGNQLFENLNSDTPVNRSHARGYVTGIADAFHDEWFCIPTGVTIGQVEDITKAYLMRMTKNRHMDATALVSAALIDAYPCKAKK